MAGSTGRAGRDRGRNASPNDAAYVVCRHPGCGGGDYGSEDSRRRRPDSSPATSIVSIDGKRSSYGRPAPAADRISAPSEAAKVEVGRRAAFERHSRSGSRRFPPPRRPRSRDSGRYQRPPRPPKARARSGKLGITVAPLDGRGRAAAPPEGRSAWPRGHRRRRRRPLVRRAGRCRPRWPGRHSVGRGTPVRTPADLRKVLASQKPGSIVSLSVYNARAQTRPSRAHHGSASEETLYGSAFTPPRKVIVTSG